MRLLFALLLVVSCGRKAESPKIGAHFATGNELMAEDVRPYFDNFVAQAKCLNIPLRYNTLKIEIVTDEIDSIGICHWSSDGNMSILLDAGHWDSLTSANREKVMVHELAHCAFKSVHTEGNAFKVMNSHLYPGLEYEFMANYDLRIKEVFGATENTACVFAYQDLEASPDTGGTGMAMRLASYAMDEVLSYGHDHHDHTGHDHHDEESRPLD